MRMVLHLLVPALIGAMAGCNICAIFHCFPPEFTWTNNYPLPHHIAKTPGGTTLRYSMIHDVIHERYERHGEVYHRDRIKRNRKAIAEDTKKEGAYFALVDDLSVSLQLRKEYMESITLLRDKLRMQEALDLGERAKYTTYANLGGSLFESGLQGIHAGDPSARDRLAEGFDMLQRSIKANPDAHFGREMWQLNYAALVLAALDRPEVLLEYDLTGNELNRGISEPRGGYQGFDPKRWHGGRQDADEFNKREIDPALREQMRNSITRVGAESDDWFKAVPQARGKPAPFDEPTLAIAEMWRTGSGSNPHFALALGRS